VDSTTIFSRPLPSNARTIHSIVRLSSAPESAARFPGGFNTNARSPRSNTAQRAKRAPRRSSAGIWTGRWPMYVMSSPNRELAGDRRRAPGSLPAARTRWLRRTRHQAAPSYLTGDRWNQFSLGWEQWNNRGLYRPPALGSSKSSSLSSCRPQRARPARAASARRTTTSRKSLDIEQQADLRCRPADNSDHIPPHHFQESMTCDSIAGQRPVAQPAAQDRIFIAASSTYLSWIRTICALWSRDSANRAAPTKFFPLAPRP
jgi:hypothetical protein